jgi:hypothetical protein
MQFEQRVLVDNPSSICSLGWRPLLVTGMLVQELRDHFSQPDRIEQPNLRNYLWRTGLAPQTLLIEALTKWNPQQAGARPAVLVRRNDWQVTRRGIGDRLQMATALDGWERYNVLMAGSHTLFCIARESGECESLAAEIYLQLLGCGPKLREYLDLLRFTVVEVGAMSMVLEAREHFGVPITVAYAHNQTWTVRKHTPILDTIALENFVP